MGQFDDLKVFVSERLRATASEILGAIEKAIKVYQDEQICRLKEENDRHRSLLDKILKAKQLQKSGLSIRETRAADFQWVFTSRTDFLKFADIGDCPYCLLRNEATETHLMTKHYLFAVHFRENDTKRFVVPCWCKDRIQCRSHWHCPCCRKIIYRKCSFERHMSKQHGYVILQQSQVTEVDQPSVSAITEAPMSPQHRCQQAVGSLDQKQPQPQTSVPLHIKEEEQDTSKPVSHLELQNSEQLQIRGQQIQKGNSQAGEQSLEADHAQYSELKIVCVRSCIQEMNSVESNKECPLTNSSTQILETRRDSGISGIQRSRLKELSSKRKKLAKRSLPSAGVNVKKPTPLPVSQNPSGPYNCKACGKTFHYMYTLRTHVQAHTVDKTHICGICGKHLESTVSLVQHLQSHTKRNKCGICGKLFSNNARVKRHRRLHRPKGINIKSNRSGLETTDGRNPTDVINESKTAVIVGFRSAAVN